MYIEVSSKCMPSVYSPDLVPMIHWYDEDEIMIFSGKIADFLIGSVDTDGFSDDEIDAMRNAAATACEKIMKHWTEEPDDEDTLPVRLVVEMERAGSFAIIQTLNDILLQKTQQNGDLTSFYSLV